jgi:trichohyalin
VPVHEVDAHTEVVQMEVHEAVEHVVTEEGNSPEEHETEKEHEEGIEPDILKEASDALKEQAELEHEKKLMADEAREAMAEAAEADAEAREKFEEAREKAEEEAKEREKAEQEKKEKEKEAGEEEKIIPHPFPEAEEKHEQHEQHESHEHKTHAPHAENHDHVMHHHSHPVDEVMHKDYDWRMESAHKSDAGNHTFEKTEPSKEASTSKPHEHMTIAEAVGASAILNSPRLADATEDERKKAA